MIYYGVKVLEESGRVA